jgi:hypothetical protein
MDLMLVVLSNSGVRLGGVPVSSVGKLPVVVGA